MDIAMRAVEASATLCRCHRGNFSKNNASQLPADNHLAISVNPKHPKNRVRYIKTDCPNCLHDWLL